jgi:hypothetical protein
VAGPFGWAGAVFVAAALMSDMVAAVFMVLLVANRDGRFVLPMIIAFFLTFPLLGVALALWLIGSKRAGTLRPSSMPKDRQRELFGAYAVMNIGALLGIGAFIFLALWLTGTRRLVFAMVPILLAWLPMHFGQLKVREIHNRPAPRLLGLSPRQQTIIFVALSLSGSALLIMTGLFWMPG